MAKTQDITEKVNKKEEQAETKWCTMTVKNAARYLPQATIHDDMESGLEVQLNHDVEADLIYQIPSRWRLMAGKAMNPLSPIVLRKVDTTFLNGEGTVMALVGEMMGIWQETYFRVLSPDTIVERFSEGKMIDVLIRQTVMLYRSYLFYPEVERENEFTRKRKYVQFCTDARGVTAANWGIIHQIYPLDAIIKDPKGFLEHYCQRQQHGVLLGIDSAHNGYINTPMYKVRQS